MLGGFCCGNRVRLLQRQSQSIVLGGNGQKPKDSTRRVLLLNADLHHLRDGSVETVGLAIKGDGSSLIVLGGRVGSATTQLVKGQSQVEETGTREEGHGFLGEAVFLGQQGHGAVKELVVAASHLLEALQKGSGRDHTEIVETRADAAAVGGVTVRSVAQALVQEGQSLLEEMDRFLRLARQQEGDAFIVEEQSFCEETCRVKVGIRSGHGGNG